MLADDAAPVAISLCAFAHDPAAFADKDVTFRALVQKTPVSGTRLLDAGHPEDDSCTVSVGLVNPGPAAEPAKARRGQGAGGHASRPASGSTA